MDWDRIVSTLRSAFSWADAVSLVAAAVGAFLGTGSAYLLEERRRRRREADARYSSLLQAQIAMGMQLNTLANLRDQYLDEHRDDPNRYMKLVPIEMGPADLEVDVASISFIAEIDDVELLQRVYLAQQRYLTSVAALSAVSSHIVEFRYKGAIARGPVDIETGEAVGVFDPAKVVILRQLVDALYQQVDQAIELQLTALKDLADLMKRHFKKRGALHFEVPEQQPPG